MPYLSPNEKRFMNVKFQKYKILTIKQYIKQIQTHFFLN